MNFVRKICSIQYNVLKLKFCQSLHLSLLGPDGLKARSDQLGLRRVEASEIGLSHCTAGRCGHMHACSALKATDRGKLA